MRDLSLAKESQWLIHGYSKTNEKHIREVLDAIDVQNEDSFLDIGCGKGVVLKEASRYPFKKIAGIELSEQLAKCACRNFEKLGINDKIDIICSDAVQFDGYEQYNVFYMFNPFSRELVQQVIKKIKKANFSRCLLIYHNPAYKDVLEEDGRFMQVGRYFDKLKEYETIVYQVIDKN